MIRDKSGVFFELATRCLESNNEIVLTDIEVESIVFTGKQLCSAIELNAQLIKRINNDSSNILSK